MVKDGIYYGLAWSVAGVVLGIFLHPAAGVPCFALAAFCLYFFRDPDRQSPPGPVAVSPADGKVVAIQPAGEDGSRRLSIFLNVFDVHVNRAPIAGRITDIRYTPGKFKVASLDEASAENEQNALVVDDGRSRVTFKQIAGLVARRIVCNKKVGDSVEKGERFGLIKFGSRMDVVLGPEWELMVQCGERVRAGSSVLARRRE